jgi:8-oxo-dGTP pyrophosphatase MutT (NUDIX family)|tara:strand:+ start:137 stop:598 length:462 start_codon:yes stop_codon:yes gene_type:complete
MNKHFTSTGYVIYQNQVLLHRHKKINQLLPPGGHLELNETPVDAVLREVKEETGLDVELIFDKTTVSFSYPLHIPTPEIILLEDIQDPETGFHQHIDFIYFCIPTKIPKVENTWIWFNEDSLLHGHTTNEGLLLIPPLDVVEISLKAIRKLKN